MIHTEPLIMMPTITIVNRKEISAPAALGTRVEVQEVDDVDKDPSDRAGEDQKWPWPWFSSTSPITSQNGMTVSDNRQHEARHDSR